MLNSVNNDNHPAPPGGQTRWNVPLRWPTSNAQHNPLMSKEIKSTRSPTSVRYQSRDGNREKISRISLHSTSLIRRNRKMLAKQASPSIPHQVNISLKHANTIDTSSTRTGTAHSGTRRKLNK